MTAGYDYSIDVKHIEEHVIPDKRLGRQVRHDSRNRNFAYAPSGQTLKGNRVRRYIPILNQMKVGSCTGNAETGKLGSGAMYRALQASQAFAGLILNESFAQSLYSAAETLDGDGPYPPNDNGSSGPSVCQAALNAGYISSYVHTFSLNDILDALSSGQAVIVGSNWYDSFDTPDANSGLVSISPNASVRGGHEWLARGINPEAQTIFADNSWGTGWGLEGSFHMSWPDLERLLGEQGDGTISMPLAVTS